MLNDTRARQTSTIEGGGRMVQWGTGTGEAGEKVVFKHWKGSSGTSY